METKETRLLTNTELGAVISLMRKMYQWSQETLAELSGLTTRTIQRIEKGEGASVDSRRALAKAFGNEDLDIYNKPFSIPAPDEMERQKAIFERDRVIVNVMPLSMGKEVARLAETTQAHSFTTADGLPLEIDMALAQLEDIFIDYRDIHDHYSAIDKVSMYVEFQEKLGALTRMGVHLCYATRRIALKGADKDQRPFVFTIAYVLACRKEDMPEKMAVKREISFG